MHQIELIESKNMQNKYLYLISSPNGYQQLCSLELKYIFNEKIDTSYYLTDRFIESSRSVFIKGRVDILYMDNNLDNIISNMMKDQLYYNKYKIYFSKFDKVPYQERLSSMRKLGFAINGDFAISNPEIEFIVTKLNGIWIFGQYHKNPKEYINRMNKPINYSNALEVLVAKTIVNIAIHNDFDLKLIDPCCGIGTVLIEARAMGVDITGYEMNPLVKMNCNMNLKHYGFIPDVVKIDMLKTNKHFDVAILDLPYGLFSATTNDKQKKLIKKTKELSSKSIIITIEDMSNDIIDAGLTITDTCVIKKSNAFQRYIFVCKSITN